MNLFLFLTDNEFAFIEKKTYFTFIENNIIVFFFKKE